MRRCPLTQALVPLAALTATACALLLQTATIAQQAPRLDRGAASHAGGGDVVAQVRGPTIKPAGLVAQAPPRVEPAEPGVTSTIQPDVPPVYAEAVPEVVRVARETFDGLFPELSLSGIHLVILTTPGYYERTTTDRKSTIYVSVGAKGLGEAFRPDADPVAILCEAVAELRNPWRLPGFTRYIAHRYLVPAVTEALGTEVLPNTQLDGPADDPTGLFAITDDLLYATVHPDYAAVRALAKLDAVLGLEGLKTLLNDLPEGANDPILELRVLAVAKDAALADVFALYDVATTLEVDEDESCLIASFEENELMVLDPYRTIVGVDEVPLLLSNEFQMSTSHDWATHGDVSLKLRADTVRRHLSARIVDSDWRFKDWTQFSRFEIDLLLQADEPQSVRIRANDAAGDSHGTITIWPPGHQVQPGQAYHISFPLTPAALAGEAMWGVPYYDGQTRASEITDLFVHIPNPTGPFTLYLDNIRLVPRDEGGPIEVGAVAPGPDVQPKDAPASDGVRAEVAETHVRFAVAAKRAGRLAEAEEALHKALEVDPDRVEAHRVLAWVLVDLGREDEAIEEFRQVLELTEDEAVRDQVERALERLE